MCGIVGYVGEREALPILMDGLARLEYRGYDSAGVALLGSDGRLRVAKQEGKLARLRAQLDARAEPPSGPTGLGHTRWATHGPPTTINAHPHHDEDGRLVLVHNGIIENYAPLREALRARGHRFDTETDTEVLVHLIEEAWYGRVATTAGADGTTDRTTDGDATSVTADRGLRGPAGSPIGADGPSRFAAAVRAALRQVEGAYALVVMSEDLPGTLVAARHFSPLVLGLGEGEQLVASDIPALLSHTRRVLLLEDGDVALVERAGVTVTDLAGQPQAREALTVTWDAAAAEKGGYAHFVRKEIDEQPGALADTLRGRLDGDRIHLPELAALDLDAIRRICVVACGTSLYAGMLARLMLERWARLPVEVAIASELRYGDPVLGPESLVILVSQSGETADTLAAQRLARAKGAPTLAVTNSVGSSITRAADATLYLQVGPEIGVVATKTFTGQLAVLTLLAAELGRRRGHFDAARVADLARDLRALPEAMTLAIAGEPAIRAAAEALADRRSMFFIGRGFNHPVALEAALKLKEISYIHAEGYPAGELKHGPIAMLDPSIPVFAFATPAPTYDKLVSNLEEVRARGAELVVVAGAGDTDIARLAERVLYVPVLREELEPFVNATVAQLFAYHAAVALGRDVDQPRNLAKSVTVE
ncbi:MAG: glutamine--fructose-6-phosphate transaminase (isomerizing) [Caldilineae bacterium]|nr:glutamine--fructose-6-phosphate transaminase (isomerizing) [Chloroflexota bacterium]MCB9176014.1 glutamine--fructose-6-phosphate transaminase (isomerizing) [Caldilineae bacterium]